MPPPVVLLGPQRLRPTLVESLERVAPDGDVAAITAGWEEREAEIDELTAHVRRRVENLRLYARSEEVFVRDRALFLAYRNRRLRLREAQTLYRQRLAHAMASVLETAGAARGDDLRRAAHEDALDAVRRLDAWHERRITEELDGFDAAHGPHVHPEIARHREEIGRIVDCSGAIAIAGGNVAALLGRLRMFGIAEHFDAHPVLAWSAGAMVLGQRIVIYHDSPPQGAGHPELFAPGLGLVRGVLPLPHAHRRLRLDDPQRIAIFARRFAPLRPLALADGATLDVRRSGLRARDGVRELEQSGALVAVGA